MCRVSDVDSIGHRGVVANGEDIDIADGSVEFLCNERSEVVVVALPVRICGRAYFWSFDKLLRCYACIRHNDIL